MRLLLLSFIFLASSQVFADTVGRSPAIQSSDQQIAQHIFSLDIQALRNKLLAVSSKNEFITGQALTLSLPLPDGRDTQLTLEETHILAPQLAQQFPDIKTYKVLGINTLGLQGRVDISAQGLFAVLQTQQGREIFIEPVVNGADEQTTSYRSVWSDSIDFPSVAAKSEQHEEPASCQTIEDASVVDAVVEQDEFIQARSSSSVDSIGTNIYKYRIAVSAANSYVTANGGTKASAMAAIVRTINRVNQVYERDTGIRLELVANNDQLIFPSNDPFSGSLSDMISQNQSLIDGVIGSENYDVGHLFTARGGGLAYVGSACRSNVKAMGISGNISVGRERFSLEFVAHEIGHQFSATHTFNSNQGLCSANNRSALTAYEPGSGSTIMSYTGICGSDNLQSHADAMFHIGSIKQVLRHKRIHQVNGCGELVSADNTAPEVNAGDDFVIPANTPFELVGVAADSDNDRLLYHWEQQDAGIASPVDEDTGNNALFRSYLPTVSKQRMFPRQESILGLEVSKGETLPTTNRIMHFQFIAKDSKGAMISDSMMVNVVTDSNTFHLHTPPLYYTRGEDVDITWEVANTHLPPVSCSSVDIRLSTDNGLHFNQVLASNVPNSGSASISLPSSVRERTEARLKLSCSDNIFFSISSRPFGVANEGTPIPVDSSGAIGSEVSVVSSESSGISGGGGSFSLYWLLSLGLLSFYYLGWRSAHLESYRNR